MKAMKIPYLCIKSSVFRKTSSPLFPHTWRLKSSKQNEKDLEEKCLSDWDYSTEKGPAVWYKKYPVACGCNQSPVPLVSDSPVSNIPLSIHGYKTPLINVLTNHVNANFCVEKNDSTYLTGVHGTSHKYYFDHVHFHWGDHSKHGSEHTIDGKTYPCEMHLVHSKNNKPISNALSESDGIAVLGFMFELSKDDNTALLPLSTALKNLPVKENSLAAMPHAQPLSSLLPEATEKGYLWYSGSLTTPPLTEAVLWTVFLNPIKISEHQMTVFRNTKCAVNNWRPVQPLNNRTVYKSFSLSIH